MNASSTSVDAHGSERNFSSGPAVQRPSWCVKLVLGLVALAAGPAWAERAIAVEVTAPLPFDAAELRDAMRLRLPVEGAPIRVRVSPTTGGIQPGLIVIEARAGVRAVDVAGLRGTAAARLVALAANDLLLDDLASPPSSPRGATTFAATGGVAGWERMLGGAGFDLAVPYRSGVIAIEVGAGSLLDGPVKLTAGIARVSAGVRAGLFEVRAGLTLAPIFVGDGAGDSTVLAGAGASVRLRIPVSPRLRAVFAAGADVFATRTEYRIDGSAVLTTPRLAPALAIGMEVAP
jgi:hypothetical protein